MNKSTYKISKMDCASEESMIRMKLDSIPSIAKLDFNLSERILTVFHKNDLSDITKNLSELNLGSTLLSSEKFDSELTFEQEEINRKYLLQVLIINFSFFLIEIIVGFIANSMGLVADSLDMLADAIVYGMSFLVVGKTLLYKKRVAKLSGYFQLTLALLGFSEVIRRYFLIDEIPNYQLMIIISAFALIANAISLYILQRSRSSEVHMKASMIFTSNDIIVNAGVIVAAIFVLAFSSPLPDLIIGVVIFTLVLRGSIRILKLR